jgi:hypothetical protein
MLSTKVTHPLVASCSRLRDQAMPDWNIRYHSFNTTLPWPCQGRFSAKAPNPLAWVPHYIHNIRVSESSDVLSVQEWLKGTRKFDLLSMKLALAGYPLSGKKLCLLPNSQWLRQWAEFISCVSPRARYEIEDQSPSSSNFSRAVNIDRHLVDSCLSADLIQRYNR